MTDKQFNDIIELAYAGGGWIPYNERANELSDNCVKGEVIGFIECTVRDLKFHRCYMSLLGFIWDYMPKKFKTKVPKNNFYQWLKHLQGRYKVLYEFVDGTRMIEYESISFGKMSDKRFHEYIKEQLPFIYENVIGAFFEGDMYDNIISTIEDEYKKFMSKL